MLVSTRDEMIKIAWVLGGVGASFVLMVVLWTPHGAEEWRSLAIILSAILIGGVSEPVWRLLRRPRSKS